MFNFAILVVSAGDHAPGDVVLKESNLPLVFLEHHATTQVTFTTFTNILHYPI